jgi:hypothetical protein
VQDQNFSTKETQSSTTITQEQVIRFIPQIQTAKQVNVISNTDNRQFMDAAINTDHEVFIFPQTNIKSERMVAPTQHLETSESEDDLINAIGQQIGEYCNQIEERDDISIISDSDDDYYSDTEDINSCFGENGSSFANIDDFSDETEINSEIQINEESKNIIAAIQNDNLSNNDLSQNLYPINKYENGSNYENETVNEPIINSSNKPTCMFNLLMIRNMILLILKTIAISCIRELTATTAAMHTIKVQQ